MPTAAMRRLSTLLWGGGDGGSRGRTSSRGKSAEDNRSFRFTVPDGCYAGQTLRIMVSTGREVEIVLPQGCRSGQSLMIRICEDEAGNLRGTSDGMTGKRRASALEQVMDLIRSNAEATQASIGTLWSRLSEELEVQKAMWASSATAPQSSGHMTSTQSGLAGKPVSLSQTQALVCAAADVKDYRQLLAALSEARTFSAVSPSLEEAVRRVSDAEEASVTWRLLLAAFEAKDVEGIETWLEQAKLLGFEVPVQLLAKAVAELEAGTRLHAMQNTLRFALEAGNKEHLREAIKEAEASGYTGALLEDAKRALVRGSRSGSPSRRKPDAAAPPPPAPQAGSRKPTQPGGSSRSASSSRRAASGGDDAAGPPQEGAANAVPRMERMSFVTNGGGTRKPATPSPVSSTLPEPPPPANEVPKRVSTSYASVNPRGERSVRELLEECRRLGIETAGCTEREDVMMLLRCGKRSPTSSTSATNASYRPAPPAPSPRPPAASPTAASAAATNAATASAFAGGKDGQGDRASGGGDHDTQGKGRSTVQVPVNELAEKAMEALSDTSVWDRTTPPPYLASKKSKAMYLLGMDPRAANRISAAELRTAYRRAAMECHPDRAQNHDRAEEAKDLFQQVKEAFDVLSGCTVATR